MATAGGEPPAGLEALRTLYIQTQDSVFVVARARLERGHSAASWRKACALAAQRPRRCFRSVLSALQTMMVCMLLPVSQDPLMERRSPPLAPRPPLGKGEAACVQLGLLDGHDLNTHHSGRSCVPNGCDGGGATGHFAV